MSEVYSTVYWVDKIAIPMMASRLSKTPFLQAKRQLAQAAAAAKPAELGSASGQVCKST